eukprot:CAMPEP_0197562992 /NCGR_PEP_ID=MMETSP1320-20131121/27908_1 /TAXON_ID=91990 /ORGANISM="Bolidomonas sp., Strain RCC2347" /LENGTH=185 /DNA_ID=CAMNT_0043124761 /DNA_START=46 /DNA_END=602 /DNA_ORIENTATION=+
MSGLPERAQLAFLGHLTWEALRMSISSRRESHVKSHSATSSLNLWIFPLYTPRADTISSLKASMATKSGRNGSTSSMDRHLLSLRTEMTAETSTSDPLAVSLAIMSHRSLLSGPTHISLARAGSTLSASSTAAALLALRDVHLHGGAVVAVGPEDDEEGEVEVEGGRALQARQVTEQRHLVFEVG